MQIPSDLDKETKRLIREATRVLQPMSSNSESEGEDVRESVDTQPERNLSASARNRGAAKVSAA